MTAPKKTATERAAPLYCPYCAEEDLRPVEQPHGAWRCTGCLRVFVVTFAGLAAHPAMHPAMHPAAHPAMPGAQVPS